MASVYGHWEGRRWDGVDGRTKDGRTKDERTKDAGTKDARTKDARTANSGYSLDGRTEPRDAYEEREALLNNPRGYLFLPKQTRSCGLSVWTFQQYKTSSKCPSRISTRVDLSEPVSAQYDHNHAPPTASALRKQRLKSTLLNADLLKGFAEISEDVEIRPFERKAARQVFNRQNSLIDAAIFVLQFSSNYKYKYKLNNNSLNEVPSYRPDSTKSLPSQRLSSYRLPSHCFPSQRLPSQRLSS